MLRCGFLCLALLALTSALVCPDGLSCDGGSACCLDASGEYSCCPRPLPVVLASFWRDESDVICPNLSGCPSEYSCLKFLNTYKCCPLSQGVLCSDGSHCCPEHHRCAEDGHACVKEKAGLVGAVICPDGESECPDGSTCCQFPDGSWGCCPMAKAVCCEDRVHCCPEGSVCDTRRSKCRSPHGDTPMLSKSPARRRAVGDDHTALRVFRYGTEAKDRPAGRETAVICPDGKQCPDATTCCLLSNGTYGCCPFEDAVCCSDHLHCCPSGTTCDLEHQTCKSATSQTPLVKTTAASKDVDCPDGRKCPGDSTCCEFANGTYGCCMFENAVCCEDHVHCCPHGTTCDLSAGTCDDGLSSLPWLEKLPSRPRRPNKAQNVSCDPLYACPDGSTCCKKEGGGWACCPLPEAACCEDHTHCCPQGTTCNVAEGTCEDAVSSVPWLEKLPPLPRPPNKAQNVSCDPLYVCPDDYTCCKTEEGGWACCPLPEAVCCEDHTHCCPQGTTCNVAEGTCEDAVSSVSWLEKLPSLPRRPNKMGDVSCDPSHSCPDGTTCCRLEGGEWSCCPLPKAVCCDDQLHCCPKGTTCNVAAGTCDDNTGSVPWLEKVPALPRMVLGAKIGGPGPGKVQCNDTMSCPDDNTCCWMKSKHRWGCCPLPTAVCCKDGEFCCPFGYTCTSTKQCTKGRPTIPWYTKTAALTRPALPGDVQCDPQSSCPSGTTCCPLSKLQWGCCSLNKAVCCEDMKHCCPAGYTCDPQRGSCHRSGAMRWDRGQNPQRKALTHL